MPVLPEMLPQTKVAMNPWNFFTLHYNSTPKHSVQEPQLDLNRRFQKGRFASLCSAFALSCCVCGGGGSGLVGISSVKTDRSRGTLASWSCSCCGCASLTGETASTCR